MTFKHILVATDFSESAQQALKLALSMAQKFDSKLTLVHSWEAPGYSYGGGLYLPVDLVAPIEQAAVARLEEAMVDLKERFPTAQSALRNGVAWEQVLAGASDLKADLIVMGTHGRKGIERALLGSVAEKVVRMARVPVLTVHEAGG
jgi:nucleotide-binding universal stress UspA family protein